MPIAYLPEGDPHNGSFWGCDGRLPPCCAGPADLFRAVLEMHYKPCPPEVRVNHRLEQYLLLSVELESCQGLLCVGPVLSYLLDDDAVLGMCRDLGVDPHNRRAWLDYYRSLPVLGRRQLLHLGILLHWLLSGEKLEMGAICQRDMIVPRCIATTAADTNLLQRRMLVDLHPAADVEGWILACIREGYPEGLRDLAKLTPKGGLKTVSLASHSYLRSLKNMFIAFLGACARAAVEGQLPREESYTVTDLYIREIEDLPDVRTVEDAAYRAFLELATRVQRTGEKELSPIVRACRDFICDHLYEEITLEQLANLVGVSSGHLSRMFTREVGLSPIRYVRWMRIEEAKRLIALTNNSLVDIAAMLRFHDQAHFTKVFKQQVGLAPGSYRRLSQQLP